MSDYSKVISKHEKMYNSNNHYREEINKLIYENFREFIINYSIDDDTSEEIMIKSRNLVEIDVDELKKELKLQYEEEYKNKTAVLNSKLEIKELEFDRNIKDIEVRYKDEIKNIQSQHQKEISEYKSQIDELKENYINKSSIGLGNIGEKNLSNMFQQMGKNVVDTHKINHVCDLWIDDEKNKILYIIESKNKKRILTEDIDKFKSDLMNIRQNIIPKKYPGYKSTGLFISLNSDTINSHIGSFSFTLDISYITSKYIFEEFFEIYFKSIEAVFNVPTTENYDKVLGLITNEYHEMKNLLDLCDNINKNSREIINMSDVMKKQLNDKIYNFKDYLIKLKSQYSEQLLKENEIKEYIRTHPKFTVKEVKEMAKNYDIFKGKTTKQSMIAWANE